MKKLFLLLTIFIAFLFTACEKDNLNSEIQSTKDGNYLKSGNSLTICHQTGNGWQIMNINPNAWPAHEAHGDAADMDGDGYFDRECGCSDEIDCDDQDATVNPGAEEICGNGIDDNCDGNIDEGCASANGAPAVLLVNTGDYYLEVQPIDNNNIAYWSTAFNLCDSLVDYGHSDWYLPTSNELNAIYQQLGPSGNGFGGSNDITLGKYWSSTTFIFEAIAQDFESGSQEEFQYNTPNIKYRCVRKQ